MAKQHVRRLGLAAERVQPALQVLGELRRAIEDGRPLSRQLLLIEELSELLFIVEDAVGCRTPATLFA